MSDSTLPALLLTIPWAQVPLTLLGQLLPVIREIAQLIRQFRTSDITPTAAFEFENALNGLLREIGRLIVDWVYNHLEPNEPDLLPIRLDYAGGHYRRRDKTANRHVATLFGTITLMRFLYQPVESAERSIFPLEIRLGLEAGIATPALADRLAIHSANCTQNQVREILTRDHGVGWSVKTLRKVTASVSEGMAEHRHAAQVAKLLAWLKQADTSSGNRKPVLAVGRDGIFLPIRHEPCYREGGTATLSVYDRRGQRLGTVYLGRMPEAGQGTLSDQLTTLIEEVLAKWDRPLPRLAYVTDAGHHPTEYFDNVLSNMRNPRRPDEYLAWEWVVDYYHACEYISKLAEALFGAGREAHAWAAKMRKWLKNKPGGINRVLHSTAAVRHKRGLVGTVRAYDQAYNYLRGHMPFMDYVDYRNRHLPIGSGVTEAACKTMFTQRLKQSGMSWDIEKGQTIVDLRVIQLSGVWGQVRQQYLSSKTLPDIRTQPQLHRNIIQNAA
jgi:hypothetical protein